MAGSGRSDPLAALRAEPGRTAILLDFDGSLSEIVERPELASAVGGAPEILAELAARYGMVAAISGRSTDDLRRLLGVPSVRLAGHYGRLVGQAPLSPEARERVAAAARGLDGVWLDDKGESVAVHYRLAPAPGEARDSLMGPLAAIARDQGLELIEGKMVLELVPAGAPRKGEAVIRLAGEIDAVAAMFAGDDLADIEAFEGLNRLAADGVAVVKVAVRGPETPEVLLRAADVTVEGPPGLVELLQGLR